MNDIQITSLEAFQEIQKSLPYKESEVLRVLREYGPMSNAEIMRALGWQINSVTPRCKALREKGLVEECGTQIDRFTGKRVAVWRRRSPAYQTTLI